MEGIDRWKISDQSELGMIIPSAIRRCVCFVGFKMANGKYSFRGTAFFISRVPGAVDWYEPIYVVTAAHVIERIRDLGCAEVFLRLNFQDGQARSVATSVKDWILHDGGADVAVLPVMRTTLGEYSSHDCYSIKSGASHQVIDYFRVGPGEDVFIVGLFTKHQGQTKNIPIVRTGNLAAMREELVPTGRGLMDAYLIESKSMGGLSGSPVFLYLGVSRPFQADPNAAKFDMIPSNDGYGVNYLLGLIHGHWEEDAHKMDASDDTVVDLATEKKVNMGVAIVVPVERILETMDDPRIQTMVSELITVERSKDLPTEDFDEEEEIPPFTREDFESALKKVSRRIEPSRSGEGK